MTFFAKEKERKKEKIKITKTHSRCIEEDVLRKGISPKPLVCQIFFLGTCRVRINSKTKESSANSIVPRNMFGINTDNDGKSDH